MTMLDRREFLKTAAAAAVATWGSRRALASDDPALATVVVVHGTDAAKMLEAGLAALGGWPAFVPAGRKTTLKVNAAWASTPEQGANTNPELVGACIRACLGAGAATVVLPENPCSPAEKSFEMSGIGAAARRAGARLYEPGDKDFVEMDVPQGTTLRRVAVAREVIETDCLINMPVAKTHNGAVLTLSMKNWMGSVRDRGFWHRNGLHQCIVDFSTLVKPRLIILDATRIMVTNGPRGPGRIERPEQIVLGTDPVAVDAYAATLFKKAPFDVPHIQIAHERGIGCGDLSRVSIQHLQA